MGAAGCRGAFGVTLQFALALSTRGFCGARRELNLAHRRTRAPRLLVAASEVLADTASSGRREKRSRIKLASAVGLSVSPDAGLARRWGVDGPTQGSMSARRTAIAVGLEGSGTGERYRRCRSRVREDARSSR